VTLTKQDLVDSIYGRLGGSEKESSDLLESTLDIIKSTLASGEDVLISRFGKFYLLEKGERPARNPKTGQEVMIGRRRVVAFRCSPVLKDKLNRGG
jgi:integration host factor subunit alpha